MPADAKSSLEIDPDEYAEALKLAEGAPGKVWDEYFAKKSPSSKFLCRLILELNQAKKYDHVIALLEAALISGHTKPWMHEVLAVTMEVSGHPKEEVERVLLSRVDFSAMDVQSMMFSAAYMTRFGRNTRALQLYRQASQLDPLQPEPYILGLKFAREAKDVDAIEWAAAGILTRAWTKGHEALHKQAEQAVADTEALLRNEGNTKRLEEFDRTIAEARQRDLVLRLTWSGDADIDMIVEEPAGTVCSYETPYSRGGGVLVHEGSGPNQKNTYELYVCPFGVPGDYRIIVRYVGGNVVAKQASLSIIRYQGTSNEIAKTHAVPISQTDYVLRISLHQGRRKELAPAPPENVAARPPRRRQDRRTLWRILGPENPDPRIAEASRAAEWMGAESANQLRNATAGFQPIVQTISEGVSMRTSAVVSADRRYVRLSMFPSFSTITDIFTFTFSSPGGGATGQQGGAATGGRR